MPLFSFDTSWKPEVFWCFLGVSKETSGMKWVKSQLARFSYPDNSPQTDSSKTLASSCNHLKKNKVGSKLLTNKKKKVELTFITNVTNYNK